MSDNREKFLERWSRLKRESEQAPAQQPEPEQPPELPPVESLDFESDFSGFMHSKVDPDLRREALKKLFSSAHYQAMDGLDVYIGDYSNPEPLTPALLATLAHAKALLADDKKENPPHLAEASDATSARDSASVDGQDCAGPESAAGGEAEKT